MLSSTGLYKERLCSVVGGSGGCSSLEQDAVAKEVASCSTVHLAHDLLGVGVDTFGAAVVVGHGEAGVHGGAVEFEARVSLLLLAWAGVAT